MSGNYRQNIIRLVTFLGGLYFALEFLLPKSVLEAMYLADKHAEISDGFIAFGAVAFGLGLINLFMVHGSKIIFKRKDWFYSAVLLIGLVAMMTVTTLDWISGYRVSRAVDATNLLGEFSKKIVEDHEKNTPNVPDLEFRKEKLRESVMTLLGSVSDQSKKLSDSQDLDSIQLKLLVSYQQELAESASQTEDALSAFLETDALDATAVSQSLSEFGKIQGKLLRFEEDRSQTKHLYDFFFNGLFISLGSAMFSLLGVYIAAAAYRAFRIRSMESALMMLTALIVMLGQIPFGIYLYEDLPSWRLWLMEIPNSAAFRAIKIGASVAGLVMAFRMWFSIESESFSQERKAS